MSLGNLKKLQAAERLLKQGKTSEALEQLERLAKAAPSDVLTINRMGDLLARQGRTGEAIGYYFKIAKHYTDGGYLPKAIAIYKKIVRLDPKSSISLSRLGDLYLKQKLPAEAQRFLSTAAQQYEEAGDHAGAREVYEKLVEAQPDSPVHRAKLADAMAAAGDTASALAELLNLGDSLQRAGKSRDAETIYRRAQKLDPVSAEPVLGIARALRAQGDANGAIGCLEESAKHKLDPQVLSELALLYDNEGRVAETERLLRTPGAAIIPGGAVGELLDLALSRGEAAAFWGRLDRVISDWKQQGYEDRIGDLLERLTQAEDHAHIPALERFERHLTDMGDSHAAASVLERLVTACRTVGDAAAAEQALERLKVVLPNSALLAASRPTGGTSEAQGPGQMPQQFEAPAVPLTRGDKEFVTGRLTQAEILEKYSLVDQALQQVMEVTARFPGHVAAQQKLLALRRSGDPSGVRDTLVSLALACRAAGDVTGARSAAGEAVGLGGVDPRTEEALQQLGLLGTPATPSAPTLAPSPSPVAPSVPPPVAATPIVSPTPAPSMVAEGEGFLIDFDADEDVPTIEPSSPGEAAAAALSSPAPGPKASGPVRAPGPDMLEEIRQHIAQGRAVEAQKGIIALESLGYGSDELDVLAGVAEGLLQPAVQTVEEDDDASAATATALLLDLEVDSDEAEGEASESLPDADDLSTITAALEGDAAQAEGPLTPDAGTEQGVAEVFAAFRQAVEDEVGDDSRTHYDLAIGYKEMGLLEEAIEGFAVAARAPDLAREANMMLAVCHREQGEIQKAVEHYRLAASMDCEDPEVRVATLYDLAEALIQSGDSAGALDQLRQVQEVDPTYRDVKQRIDDLETRLHA